MFAKLLKYEIKSSYKLVGLLSLVAVILGGVGAVAIRFIKVLTEMIDKDPDMMGVSIIGTMALMLLIMFVYVSIVIYVAAVSIFLLYRFYKNKFTDEGYLTFTLPVKTRDIFLSSGINMLIWSFVTSIVAYGTLVLMIIFGLIDASWFGSEALDFIRALKEAFFGDIDSLFNVLLAGVYLLMLPISLVFSTVMGMTSIVLGAVAVKKYKVLAAIGFYYGINTVVSMFGSFISILPAFIVMIWPSMIGVSIYQILTIFLQLVIYVVLTIVGYFVSVRLMERKLNLP